MKKQTFGRLQEATAAAWLGIGLIHGFIAHDYDEEASRAKSIEQTYIAQGDQEQAAGWAVYSDNQEHYRNINLGLIAIDLGVAAVNGAAGAFSLSVARRQQQEQQSHPAQNTLQA